MKTKLATLATAALLTSMSAHSGPLYYESFDSYSTGDLSTETSDVWSDNGSTIESGGLAYGPISNTGNRVTMSDDVSWTNVDFSANLDDGDTIWFSVLINTISGSNPDYGFALGTDQGVDTNNIPLANSGDGLGVRIKGGVEATAWVGGPANSSSGAGYTTETTIMVVGEMIFGAATDTINIYLPDTDLNLGAVVQTQTATLDQTAFDTISFFNKSSDPRASTDEIRFGTTVDDVLVPEPGSLALLGLGGLMMIKRRRRA